MLSHVADSKRIEEAYVQTRWVDVVAVKDNFVTDNLPTTCASYMLFGFRAPHQSTVCRLLEQDGYAVVAKTNMDEFGMGSHSLNSAAGPISNGVGSHAQSVGGSSGGSAMAVAENRCRFAIGSDTGGSVRLPAAYCGIVGFKPSYGSISRNGVIPYANSLDTVGIMARSVSDVDTVFRVLSKVDEADPTCLSFDTRLRLEMAHMQLGVVGKPPKSHGLHIRPVAMRDEFGYTEATSDNKFERYTGLARAIPDKPYRNRVGVPDEYNIAEMHPLVRNAWAKFLTQLEESGFQIVPCSLPYTRVALAAYYVIAPAEASSNLAKYDGVRYGMPRDMSVPDNHNGPLYAHHRGRQFGDEVQRRILLGNFTLSAGAMDNYFIQAQKVRRLVQQDFNSVFRMRHPLMEDAVNNPHGVDFLVVPTAPTPPPLVSEVRKATPVETYMNDVFTVPASLAGLPAVSIPITPDDDMPHTPDKNVGIQIIGQYGDDRQVLRFARWNSEISMTLKDDGRRIWKRRRL